MLLNQKITCSACENPGEYLWKPSLMPGQVAKSLCGECKEIQGHRIYRELIAEGHTEEKSYWMVYVEGETFWFDLYSYKFKVERNKKESS